MTIKHRYYSFALTKIKDSIVIVTGASTGIGYVICETLGRRGARLVLAARQKEALDSAAAKLAAAGIDAVACATDISSRDQAKKLVQYAIDRYGTVDILINNAAIGLFQTIAESSHEEIASVMSTNFFGSLNCIQECVPLMRKQKRGHIVNISSIIGHHSVYHQGVYAASKAALDRISESLQAEEAAHNIKVTLVIPDRTSTSFIEHVVGPRNLAVLPGGNMRMLTPESVAAGVAAAIESDQLVHYSSIKGRMFAALSSTFPAVIRYVMRPHQ